MKIPVPLIKETTPDEAKIPTAFIPKQKKSPCQNMTWTLTLNRLIILF